jgi:hypothetical protein
VHTQLLACDLGIIYSLKFNSMKGLMSRLMLSCEQASLLVIKKEEKKMSQIEKVQLWFHSSICGLCKEFDGQNNFINTNLEFHFNNGQDGNLELSKSDKEKMKDALLK